MDEKQLAELNAALAKAEADGDVESANALRTHIKQNTPESKAAVVADNLANAEESSLVPALGGAGVGIFGGGKVAELLASKFAPYDVNAPKAPAASSAPKTFATPEQLGSKVQANLNRPSVTVQGISDAELASRKIPGASAASNYARVLPGSQLPDKIADLAEDYTKTNPRGAGAQQLVAQDAERLAKIKALTGDNFALTGRGSGQLMLPTETISSIAAENKAAQNKLAEEAGKHAAKTRAERLLKVEELKGKPAAKIAEEMAKLKKIAAIPQKYLTKAGEVMHIASSPLTLNMLGRGLAGYGAGMGIDDAITRFGTGQNIRGVVSGLGAAGDIAAMTRHPAAMALGTAAGVGAPFLNTYLDKLAEENPELANRIGLAEGGSVPHLAIGGRPNIGRPNVAFGSQQMPQQRFNQYMAYKPFSGQAVNPAAAIGRFPMPRGYRSPVQAASTPVQQNIAAQTQTSSSLLPQSNQVAAQSTQQAVQQPMQKSFIGFGDDLPTWDTSPYYTGQQQGTTQAQNETGLSTVGGQTANNIVAPTPGTTGNLPSSWEDGFVNPYPNAPAFTGDVSSFLKAGGLVYIK